MSGGRALRRLRIPAMLVIALFLTWLGGLVWFVRTIPTVGDHDETVTDAIVVLTGGYLRVETGIRLLKDGKAEKLFVSGVHPGTDVATLLRAEHQSSAKLASRIVLGHDADNTLGNALETATWMRQEGFHSLRLVTSDYHMPRSLLEFSRVMPEMRIIAHPVLVLRNFGSARWQPFEPLRPPLGQIIPEYHKYLLALARPMLFGTPDIEGAAS